MTYWIVAGIAALVVMWRLLVRATAHGGGPGGDAAEIAGAVLDEEASFRGDDPDGRKPWDGESRLRIKPNVFGV